MVFPVACVVEVGKDKLKVRCPGVKVRSQLQKLAICFLSLKSLKVYQTLNLQNFQQTRCLQNEGHPIPNKFFIALHHRANVAVEMPG